MQFVHQEEIDPYFSTFWGYMYDNLFQFKLNTPPNPYYWIFNTPNDPFEQWLLRKYGLQITDLYATEEPGIEKISIDVENNLSIHK